MVEKYAAKIHGAANKFQSNMVRVSSKSVECRINTIPRRVHYDMQACVDNEENEQSDYDMDDMDNCITPPLPTCRHRKANPFFDDFPGIHQALARVPSEGAPSSMKPLDEVREDLKALVRTDYVRVVSELLAVMLLTWALYVYYYYEIMHLSEATDTSVHNSNQPLGDLLIVSFQLQVQGTTERTNGNQADILIPLDMLRSDNSQNLSFYLSSK
jgi:hypothetical protein